MESGIDLVVAVENRLVAVENRLVASVVELGSEVKVVKKVLLYSECYFE